MFIRTYVHCSGDSRGRPRHRGSGVRAVASESVGVCCPAFAPSLNWLPCILPKHTWFSVHMCALFQSEDITLKVPTYVTRRTRTCTYAYATMVIPLRDPTPFIRQSTSGQLDQHTTHSADTRWLLQPHSNDAPCTREDRLRRARVLVLDGPLLSLPFLLALPARPLRDVAPRQLGYVT